MDDLTENDYDFSSYYSQLAQPPEVPEVPSEVCPECGNDIVRNGRCKTCYTCGWSSCDL